MTYIATVGLTNDKTNKTFKPGARVTDKDFPKSVIAAWVKRGHLVEEAANGSGKNKD